MAYDRFGRENTGGQGRDDREEFSYSSARDYRAAGRMSGDDRDGGRDYGAHDAGRGYGQGGAQFGRRDYGQQERGQRDYGQSGYGERSYGQSSSGGEFGQHEGGRSDYGQRDDRQPSYDQRHYGGQRYGQDQRMAQGGYEDSFRARQSGIGSSSGRGREEVRQGRDSYRQSRGTFDRQPQRHGGDDRGFMDRAADEVRSWFGDEEAERRRARDAGDGGPSHGGHARDEHYHSWRSQQIAAFDRDYDEYRQENRDKFHNEFQSFRTERQSQRDLLTRVDEHMEVLGSDGQHVGTVDKVRGDRIILTKNDPDAGGHHHSIPSRWLQAVEGGKLMLRKSADEAKAHWRDEERQQGEGGGALFGGGERQQRDEAGRGRPTETGGHETGGTDLNRSFSGTY
jgi:hypothetical protein